MAVDSKELEDFMPNTELEWSDTAVARMKNVPFFVRKSVVRGIEQYAKDKGVSLIDDDVVSRARQEREGAAIEESRKKKAAKIKQQTADQEPDVKRQFVNFAFYKLDPSFRRLSKDRSREARPEGPYSCFCQSSAHGGVFDSPSRSAKVWRAFNIGCFDDKTCMQLAKIKSVP